jgi:hypothetical protein
MFRVQYPSGLSDMANWSRAYDAARELVLPSEEYDAAIAAEGQHG